MSILEILLYSIVGIIITIWLFKKLIYNKYIKPRRIAKMSVKAIEEQDEEHDENQK